MEVKSRHHLRSDAIDRIEQSLADALGVTIDGEAFEHVEFTDSETELVLVDNDPLITYFDADGSEPFLTVRGANAYPPQRRAVTVDAGAVSFVSDGADVMRPGIADADAEIDAGDLVVITEQSHGKALAIGRARVDGTELLGDSGKVVDSLHHVGDELYNVTL
ncbi:RNA-binding protein [Halocatena pleomorpha]|uniref:RNA-binding protein n=1 Tax=Halocatena pleomorpha TaxID=1785090 RepID=A0A3P3RCR0_9EURY|nr:RNA-binding protein [Halocatena pleomorpha]RRJ30749.1 RNA-binding protein [Halocatena pleomorpha]